MTHLPYLPPKTIPLIDHSSFVDEQGIADCMSKLNLLTGTTRFKLKLQKKKSIDVITRRKIKVNVVKSSSQNINYLTKQMLQ